MRSKKIAAVQRACLLATAVLCTPQIAFAAQTTNTTSTTSCTAQGGTPSAANLITDFNNGTFGFEDGSPDQSPVADPYPSTVTGGTYSNFYDISWGDYSYIANAQTPRNPYQHPDITDPDYGTTGRFFASDPNTDTPTLNFGVTNVTPNQNYELTFWAANSEPGGTPNNVDAIIEDIVAISTGPLPAIPSALEWKQYSYVFNAGDRTSLNLSMVSTETGSGGRDFYIDNVVIQGCAITGGSATGNVYSDSDTNNIYTPVTDGILTAISVQLWDTQGDSDPSNDLFVSAVSSDSSGAYAFNNIPANTYEARIITTDPDLPSGSSAGTPTTLSVTITNSGTNSGNDFGFDLSAAALEGSKTVSIYDPLAEGLYYLPGNDVIYTIDVINRGAGSVDAGTVQLIDPIPSDVEFYNGDMDDGGGLTSDPVYFTQSGAGLTFSYLSDVHYAPVGPKPASFASCNYMPLIGYDPNVGYVCIRPTGTMSGGTPDPSFSVAFRARIK